MSFSSTLGIKLTSFTDIFNQYKPDNDISLIPNVELKDMRYAIIILFVLVKDVSKAGQFNT
jgi:hypothetical protein